MTIQISTGFFVTRTRDRADGEGRAKLRYERLADRSRETEELLRIAIRRADEGTLSTAAVQLVLDLPYSIDAADLARLRAALGLAGAVA